MSFGSLPSVLGNGGGVAISVIGGTGLFADGTAAAPSISFSSKTNTGIFLSAGLYPAVSQNGVATVQFLRSGSTSVMQAVTGSSYLQLADAGSISLIAAGTNQNITLTPSGTGRVDVTGQTGGQGTPTSLRLSSDFANALVPTNQQQKLSLVYVSASESYGFSVSSDAGIWYQSGPSGSSTGYHAFVAGSTTMLKVKTGAAMVGTTVDSGALLQIGTNTMTSAGGMVFGTDTFLFRKQAGTIVLDHASGNNPQIQLYESGVLKTSLQTFTGDFYIDVQTGKSLYLRTNGSTTALTLDSSQNATFAKAVALSAGTLTATNTAATQGIFKGWNSRSGANADNGQIDVGNTTGLRLMGDASGTGGSVIDDRWDNAASSLTFRLRGNGTPVTSLTLNSTTATFAGLVSVAGALKLGNAYVAGAVVGTGYVTIQDSTGTTYRVPVLV